MYSHFIPISRRHFLHTLSLCLCFGLLLMKMMQLRSLVSVGLGGRIPQVTNDLICCFIIIPYGLLFIIIQPENS